MIPEPGIHPMQEWQMIYHHPAIPALVRLQSEEYNQDNYFVI
jgi:hypothetical protein